MIYFSLEVMTKWRGNDYEEMDVVRENFSDVYGVIKNLFLMPFEIKTIRLKQYSYNNERSTLLNCFICFLSKLANHFFFFFCTFIFTPL